MIFGWIIPKSFTARFVLLVFVTGLIPILIFSLVITIYSKHLQSRFETFINEEHFNEMQQTGQIMRNMAEDIIRQKAHAVATALDLYIEMNPLKTVEDLQKDSKFSTLALQQIGKTGYTAIHDNNTAINRFHKNPAIVNTDLHSLSSKLPQFWKIIKDGLGEKESEGYYQWQEADGSIRDKFMCIVPLKNLTADNSRLAVAATTYMDEFTGPLLAVHQAGKNSTQAINDVVKKATSSFRRSGFIFMCIASLISISIAFFTGRYFAHDIRKIRSAISSINKGDLNARVSSQATGDMAELIHDFNVMVDKLSTTTVRKEELEASEARLKEANADLLKEIEERKKVEDMLRDSEFIRGATLESTNDGILVVSNSNMIILTNSRFRQMWNIPDQLIQKANDDGLIHYVLDQVQDASSFITRIEALRNSYESSLDYINFKDGKIFERVSSPLVTQGKIVGRVWTFRDVTERKKAEEQLRKLSRAVEHSSSTIVITDANGNIEYANPKFTETTGYTIHEAIGKNPRILKSGETTPEEYKLLWDTITSGKEWHGEFHNKRKDGSLYWEAASIAPIADEKGKITHFVAVKDDITLRKKNEEELEQAKRSAIEANNTKSQFLANMSHEIRTPMNAIIGFSEILLQEKLAEEQKETVEIINTSANNLLALINDILDLSKVESGKMTTEEIDFSLHSLIENVVSLFRNTCSEKGVTLGKRISKDLPDAIFSDEVKVRQVLTNLLSNATKFTSNGSITVEASLDEDKIVLSVIDTGTGIPADKLDTIFEPFAQASTSTARKYGGTGLGLTLCKRFAGLIGGSISVESKEGLGSIFTFRFPYKPAQNSVEKRPEQAMQKHELNGKGFTILVAEDDHFNRKYIDRLLSAKGFNIIFANNGLEAVEKASEHPDIILMDMNMPIMSGYEATMQIKSNPLYSHIPVIALTASAMKEDRNNIMKAGCDAYVSKPVKVIELFDAIETHLPELKTDEKGNQNNFINNRNDHEKNVSQPADTPVNSSDPPEEIAALMDTLRQEYMTAFNEVIKECDSYIASHDTAGLGGLGHRIKGNGAAYGFPEISKIGSAMEQLGKAGRFDEMLEYVEKLRAINNEFQSLLLKQS